MSQPVKLSAKQLHTVANPQRLFLYLGNEDNEAIKSGIKYIALPRGVTECQVSQQSLQPWIATKSSVKSAKGLLARYVAHV